MKANKIIKLLEQEVDPIIITLTPVEFPTDVGGNWSVHYEITQGDKVLRSGEGDDVNSVMSKLTWYFKQRGVGWRSK
jgi:hypothetical protein